MNENVGIYKLEIRTVENLVTVVLVVGRQSKRLEVILIRRNK